MEVPFLWPAVGFMTGILLRCPWLASHEWQVGAGFCLGLRLLWILRGRRIFPLFLVIVFACLGNLFSNGDTLRPEDAVERQTARENRHVWLEGKVLTQPEIKWTGKKKNISFVLSAGQLSKRNPEGFERARVSGKVQVFLTQPPLPLPEGGDWVRIAGRLETPKAVLNPGGFDYGKYLAGQSIFCVLNGYGGKSLKILKKAHAWDFEQIIFGLQKVIAVKIENLFKGDSAILFKALILGTRRGLSAGVREDFFRTGTSHLLAISGLNISLVAGSLYLLGILGGLPQKMAALTAFVMMIFQVLIAGFGMPVARAGIMAGAGFWAIILNRERNSLNAFFLAFLMLLALGTRSLENVSFQLSFLSVFALMIFMGNSLSEWKWMDCFSGSLAVLAVTFPLSVIYFNSFAPVSVFANVAGIPLFDLALLTVLLALASPVPLISFWIARLAEFFLKTALAWIHLWGKMPGGYFHVQAPAPSKVIFYYGFILFITMVKVKKWVLPPKWAGGLAAGWIVSTVLFFWPLKTEGFRLTLFSAGRNEMAVLNFQGLRWLINTGRGEPSQQAEWIVTPYLRAQGIREISGVLLSDTACKHTGGLAALARQFHWRYLLFPNTASDEKGTGTNGNLYLSPFQKSEIEKHAMNSGGRVSMKGGGEIQVRDVVDGEMIFLVTGKGRRFLFLPAVNKKVMRSIDSQISELKAPDFLILPGFPSKGEAWAREIIRRLQPLRVSAPFLPETLQAFLDENNIPNFSLEKEGSLTVSFEMEEFKFWRGKPLQESGRAFAFH